MKRIIWAMACLLFFINAFAQKNKYTTSFKVWGTCDQCKERIEAIATETGAIEANWNEETNMLTITFDSSKHTITSFKKAIAKVGHDTEEFSAGDDAYKKLPKCCHYQRKNNVSSAINGVFNFSSIEKSLPAIKGIVMEENKKGKLLPLIGASVTTLNNNKLTTITDSMGVFELTTTLPVQVVINYVGQKSDTVLFKSEHEIKTVVKKPNYTQLSDVVVTSSGFSGYLNTVSTRNSLNIGSRELAKAACCNLSESFETSPSVDVSYADAVTGVKQIQLLGLSGNYTQLLTENIPEIRGLSGNYGLTFIPGPWIESIQVTKGTGSVANGYESIAGQINIEEKKPDKAEKVFINGYVNNMGRLESSLNIARPINSKWSTAVLLHGNGVVSKNDKNNDGFLDMPTGSQWNVINRWKYVDGNGIIAQIAIKALNDKRTAGEVLFNKNKDQLTTNNYGVGLDVQQYGVTAKLGYVFPQSKYKSIGLMLSGNQYNNNNIYGLTQYKADHNSLYINLIYQSIIGTTAHKFRTGLSYMQERYNETLNTQQYMRTENVPGLFFEYTYTPGGKFSAIAGIRTDFHNYWGNITTPRLHLKYDFTTKTNLRFSIGSGFRMANIFAENSQYFISSRKMMVQSTNNYGYGLNPEKAWNWGINFMHQFKVNGHNATLSIDAYRTVFNNQSVVDVDANPQEVHFYNLHGQSFSNSLQAELNMELAKKLELRMAYRWLNVQTNYHGMLLAKPLVAPHRAFVNIAYETTNKWKFDYTVQWIGAKRLPNTNTNPTDKQMPAQSPAYFQMSGQISKQVNNQWELYLGGENLSGYTQQQLFINPQAPFSPYFDGSMVWGPINGAIIYAGMRFKIK